MSCQSGENVFSEENGTYKGRRRTVTDSKMFHQTTKNHVVYIQNKYMFQMTEQEGDQWRLDM